VRDVTTHEVLWKEKIDLESVMVDNLVFLDSDLTGGHSEPTDFYVGLKTLLVRKSGLKSSSSWPLNAKFVVKISSVTIFSRPENSS
jgi:hypothetical protein